METVLIVARLVLAGVFLVAAGAKLADASGSRRALEDFAVPGRLVAFAALALPATEVLAALLLLFPATAQVGAGLAVALLFAFVAGIGAALRRGTAPDCHCFGQLHSRPAGRETIARNVVLATIGLLILVAGPGPTFGAWAADSRGERVALVASALLAGVLAYACAALWRENRRLTGRSAPPDLPTQVEAGQRTPDFTVADATGASRRAEDVLDGERTVLVFTSSTCGPCVGLLPELSRWRDMLTGRLAIHVLASGDEAENRRLSEEHGMPVLFDRGGKAANALGILGTPSAVEVDASGHIATPPAAGAPAIEALIRASLKRPAETPALQVRQVAPAVGATAGDASA